MAYGVARAGAERAGEIMADDRHLGRASGRVHERATYRLASTAEPLCGTFQPSHQHPRRPGNPDDQHNPDNHQQVGEYLPRRPAPQFRVNAHPHSVLAARH